MHRSGEEHGRKAGGRARRESGLDTESRGVHRLNEWKGLEFTRNAGTALRSQGREGRPLGL